MAGRTIVESLKGPEAMVSLEGLASKAYLDRLEDACYAYIQLIRIDSTIMRTCVGSCLKMLKDELNGRLFGVMSTSVRQDLIRKILKGGLYPSKKYQNQYEFKGRNQVEQVSEIDKVYLICPAVTLLFPRKIIAEESFTF